MSQQKTVNKQHTDKKSIENMYPLSPMQEGLLFHSLLSPTAGEYIPQVVLTFVAEPGKCIDAQRLKQAWGSAIARHSILRTGFYWEQRDQPFQVVYRQQDSWIDKLWIEQNWQFLSATEQSAKLDMLLAFNRSEPFNLNQPPLMRLTWINCGNHQYQLLWCYHHLILDGWSASQLLKDIFQQYFALASNSTAQLQPLRHSYSDYIAWLNEQDTVAAQRFWQTYLKNWAGPTSLPILSNQLLSSQQQKASKPDSSFTEQSRPLSAKATQKLKAFAQTHKLTLNTLVQGALGLVISRYCDTADVVFGATCSGRPTALEGALSMVGLFINTLPVRIQVPEAITVAEWLQSISRQQAETTDYEYVSLGELQKWVKEKNSVELKNLFDCLLVFESYPVAADMFGAQADFQLKNIDFNEWTHFPLTLLVSGEDQLTFTAKYRSEQVPSDAIGRFLGHLNNVLTAFVKKPEQAMSEISLLCSVEKRQLTEWNSTAVETYPLDQSLPSLFEAQVEKTPNAIALTFINETSQEETLTYQALNEKSNQLAHHLQGLGIGEGQNVAVQMARSQTLVIALLAVLKAGAAYVPLDPSYPSERLAYMREDADVATVLTDLALKELSTKLQQQPTDNPPRSLQPDSSAYVIYTSGSTGKPKGVINTHQGIVNRLCWMQQAYELTPSQKVLHKTPISFDVSVWELFWSLLNGATLVIAKPDGQKDPAYLSGLIQSQKVSVLHFVPSMLATFLEEPTAKQCETLKHVICSGEALSPTLKEAFFQQFSSTALHNLYGPTEAAIDVTAWQCKSNSDERTVPIGYPIANTQIHLLDSHRRAVPVGIPGEIYIGGVGVAKGYLNRPELTKERFISGVRLRSPLGFDKTDTFIEAKKISSNESKSRCLSVVVRGASPKELGTTQPTPPLYKTGDRARYLPNGAIEYIGRKDNQIKLRGVRIELGEIENALCSHPAICQAAVALHHQESEDGRLVGYVVGDLERISNLNKTLSTFLKERLPSAMVPATFVPLSSLPLTPNGKLDRRALPEPEQGERAEKVAPRNETEKAIAQIWSTVLQLEDIGIQNNFFELGGHSLSATRVNTRLRKHFELDLPLQSIFEYPTLVALATYIDALKVRENRPLQPSSLSENQRPAGYKEIEL
ncbi:non-ribosomal peptide synthetase [cf. Phormidesmis sp. LEGE 11477]|uniref:non-ribosomal peptide synthetase n=1 Tax=cf. Phormidesmis sp. LEGE 11477 TaxID=1828680 RepID=UPI001882C4B2|nr:non-ribosomal peptide synthetase [cf. Phormidesmis sp. LEGE 11477]MBE9060866.1 amino acid adenylation domain-containing protein [cf. Phormidesmis sp. LEGE 11477]